MSHFTVLVVGDNPEQQLAPFQENNMGDCPKEYLKFNSTEAEMLKDYENDTVELVRHPDTSELMFPWTLQSELEQAEGVGVLDHEGRRAIRDRVDSMETVSVPIKERYATFEVYAKEYCGCEQRDPEMGEYGYWENPNRKWDSYTLGGRWEGFFLLKDGTNADQCRCGDVDWGGMIAANKADAEEEWSNFENAPEDLRNIEAFINGIRQNETRESFVARRTAPCTFAVLKNGVWYERGDMGWWGIVSDEKDSDAWQREFEKLITNLPEDTLLSVFDCHI